MTATQPTWHNTAISHPLYVKLTGKPFIALLLLSTFLSLTLVFANLSRHSEPLTNGDSIRYFTMAHHYLEGDGFRDFVTHWRLGPDVLPVELAHWAPGYPLLLALMEWLGLDPTGYALLLVFTAFLALCLFLTALIIWEFTGSFAWASLGLLMVMASYFPHVFLSVLSEPLFCVLLMGGVCFWVQYVKTKRLTWLIATGCLFGLSWVTRYAGIGLVPPAVALVLLLPGSSLIKRVFHAAVFGVLASAPLGAWYLRSLSIQRSITDNHTLTWETPGENVKLLLDVIEQNFGHPGTLVGFVLVATGLLSLSALRGKKSGAWVRDLYGYFLTPAGSLLALSLAYGVFIFVNGTLSITIVDSRKYAPVTPLVVIAVITFVSTQSRRTWLVEAGLGLVVLFSLMTLDGLFNTVLVVTVLVVEMIIWLRMGADRVRKLPVLLLIVSLTAFVAGQMLAFLDTAETKLSAIEHYRFSPEMTWIERNIADRVLYTNAFTVLFELGYKTRVKELPRPTDARLLGVSEDELMKLLAQKVTETGGCVVFLDYGVPRQYMISEELLVASGQFVLVREFPRGRIYRPRALLANEN